MIIFMRENHVLPAGSRAVEGQEEVEENKRVFVDLYRRIIPERIRRKGSEIMLARNIEKRNREDMERKKFGDLNKDKTFYVIRTDSTQDLGVFSVFLFVLSNVKYACGRGWIPVVDFKNYYFMNLQDAGNRGKENAWNYYFEDLAPEYPLEEVYRSRNVILGPLRGQPYGSISWVDVKDLYDPQYDIYFKLASKYLRVRPDLRERIERLYQDMFPAGQDVIGIEIRAGVYWGRIAQVESWKDYLEKTKTKGKDVWEWIDSIRGYQQKYKCEYFYFTCEDEYYAAKIKEAFGDKCLCMDRPRLHMFSENGEPRKPGTIAVTKEGYTKQMKGQDYLVETFLLTKCQYLIGARANSKAAMLMKDGRYKDVVILP